MYKVQFYCDPRGRSPIKAFLDALNVKMRVKVLGFIDLLEERGPLLAMPYSKYLEDGIYELRCGLGSNTIRLLYFLRQIRWWY